MKVSLITKSKDVKKTFDKLPTLREICRLSLSRVELSWHPLMFVLVFSAPRVRIHLEAFAGSGPQVGATGNAESQQESHDTLLRHFDSCDLFFNLFEKGRIIILAFPGFEPTHLCDLSYQRRL